MTLTDGIKAAARSFPTFAQHCCGITLRPYQLEAGQAILDSIRTRRGDSIVVMMSRQAGKDELSANLKAYLLSRFVDRDAGIVEVNPTYKPQTINAIERLERRLDANVLTRRQWRKRSDFMRLFGKARVSFLSGDAHANVVGATADLLLIVNEAQDIDPSIYDKKFAPMAASTNATRVFLGTAWTRTTLLGRELRAALEAERADGHRRVFRYDADDVRSVVPAYGQFVDGILARLGRQHPLVRTQYFNEEIDAQAGMFNEARRALIFGAQPSPAGSHPSGRATYAFCIDVGGMDENAAAAAGGMNLREGRDSTTLSIVQIDLSSLKEARGGPTYRVVRRFAWTGANHVTVFGQLRALSETWHPRHIVIDATGVGEGLWAMLDKAFPTRVIPVKFSATSKSEMGYRFLAIIETGRFRDVSVSAAGSSPGSAVDAATVDRQYAACIAEVLIGPHRTMRWGVPDGTRAENGELVHDDIVLADALVSVLDRLDWSPGFEPYLIPARDPLDDMTRTRAPSSEL